MTAPLSDTDAPPFQRNFLAPRYWPTWLGVGVLRALCLLPWPVLVRLGEGIGWLAGRLLKSRRHVVRVNLRLCFPELAGDALEREIDEHFKAFGAGLFEACLAWWASDERIARRGEVVGLEHLDAAMAHGGGALLLTGHFTTLELGGRFIAIQRPFHPMYRHIDNELIDYLMHHWRVARSKLPAMPRENLRGLVRALREGRAIWYAPDQTLEMGSAFVPFFGVPTWTVTATSRLAQMGKAKVVPYFPQRIGSRYRVTFLPALDNFPSDDETADAIRINQVLEDCVRRARPQYFWIHRRFKRRPPGAPDVYDGH